MHFIPEAESVTTRHAAAAPRKSRARARFNQAMRVVRRAHLYAGLFMTPWVFLYGISGMLFNHPDRFVDQDVAHFGAAEVAGGPLEHGVEPEALAGRVVDALNASNGAKSGTDAFRLVRPGEASYNRDLFALVRGAGRDHAVRVDVEHGTGSVRAAESASGNAERFGPEGGVRLDPPPFDPVERALPDVLRKMGLPAETATVRLGPDLSFLVGRGGETWRVSYNPATGILTGRPQGTAAPLSARRFLILLHVAHEYPSRIGARWAWAIAVDLMFVAMVGWGVTGLLMWWQMKNVRRAGIVVLIASAATASAMAVGMHQVLTS